MGDLETEASASAESPLGYHSFIIGILTCSRDPGKGHCQAGSLTGAVASKRVTEAFKAWLSADGNRAKSINAEARLTVRPTSRADTKVGVSDQVVVSGNAIA